MSLEGKQDRELQIAHVLFMDIVGYSKLPINRQSELLHQLNQIVVTWPCGVLRML